MKKQLAAVTAAVLAIGVSFGAAVLPAGATPSVPYLPTNDTAVGSNVTGANQASDWVTLSGEVCVKYENITPPYTVPAAPAGTTYSKLIIKAGNNNSPNIVHENYVWYPPNIIVGGLYQHLDVPSISHVILCTIPGPITLAAPSATAPTCDVAGTLVIPAQDHITWTGGANGDGPGSYDLTAEAHDGYTFTGTSPVHVDVLAQLSGEACPTHLVATAPSVTPPTCFADGSLVITPQDHISWAGGANGAGPGTYNLVASSTSASYVLDGTTSYPGTTVLAKKTGPECDKLADVIGDPTFVGPKCRTVEGGPNTQGNYTIAAATGVGYHVKYNGVAQADVLSADHVSVADGTLVEITAYALPGFVLDDEATTQWSHNFLSPEPCDLPSHALVDPEISTTPPTCTTGGSYTIGGDVIWTLGVNGPVVPAGTHVVASAGSVTLVATLGPGDAFTEGDDQQTVWNLTFGDPIDCLKTLAFTGSEGVPLYLGGAAAMLLLGAASIFFTRRRTA